jgi:hypothetical protein
VPANFELSINVSVDWKEGGAQRAAVLTAERQRAMALRKFTISDSELGHNNWRFPTQIRLRPLRDLDDEEFLVNHKIDRSYDDSTVRFKLLVADPPVTRRNADAPPLPMPTAVREIVKKERWISDEYEHLWSRDGGGSASLTSHNTLIFILQTPRDGGSFSSLSLVRDVFNCGGFYCADENYSLNTLLANVLYENKHPKVPRDFAILPFNILVKHVDETLRQVQILSRDITATELRLSEGDISLEENGDYKLLNRFNIEQLRLQRRSNFETELSKNLIKYFDEYHRIWTNMWEGGTGYIEDMKEKVEQQMRYSEQVRVDLEIIPRRIKNQSKAVRQHYHVCRFRDTSTDFASDHELHHPKRQQAQHRDCTELSQNRGRKQARQSAKY